VRAADTVPRSSRGWDAAKKVNGRKCHIAVDTMGLVLDVVITAASVQDPQGARPLLWNARRACPRVRLIWADAGYTSTAGKLARWATTLKMTLCIVARRDRHAFEVLPRRWVGRPYPPLAYVAGRAFHLGHSAPFLGVSGRVRHEDLRIQTAAQLALQSRPQIGEGHPWRCSERACSDSYFSIMTSRSGPSCSA
jgi:transposase